LGIGRKNVFLLRLKVRDPLMGEGTVTGWKCGKVSEFCVKNNTIQSRNQRRNFDESLKNKEAMDNDQYARGENTGVRGKDDE